MDGEMAEWQHNCKEIRRKWVRSAVLNLWAADMCLVGRDQGWEFIKKLYESLTRLQMEISVLGKM